MGMHACVYMVCIACVDILCADGTPWTSSCSTTFRSSVEWYVRGREGGREGGWVGGSKGVERGQEEGEQIERMQR